ncbi:type II toxin-antitoxin system HicB family antitoxin [Peptococcaceae bacterium]|nr:type II toxin-antitoxin system HicB family antitoxin [Peptococcaceae bacterium]
MAEVPELDGCISDGKTPQEALNNIQEVIISWIEIAQERNQQIPEPKLYNRIRVGK